MRSAPDIEEVGWPDPWRWMPDGVHRDAAELTPQVTILFAGHGRMIPTATLGSSTRHEARIADPGKMKPAPDGRRFVHGAGRSRRHRSR